MKFLKLIFLGQALMLSTFFFFASEIVFDLEKQNDSAKKIQKFYREKKSKYNVDDYHIPVENITIECDSLGAPTLRALKQLMIQTYFTGKDKKRGVVKLKEGINEGLRIVQAARVGANNFRIYEVSVDYKNVFILKIPHNIVNEDTNLILLQKSAVARTGIQARYSQTNLPVRKKDLPIMCWLDRVFNYTFKNKTRAIEVLHAAKGESVADAMQHASQKRSCMVALGRALASFQLLFMSYGSSPDDVANWRTWAHGDLHDDNVFFDEVTSRIYFIDNGGMLSDFSIFTDLNRILASIEGLNMRNLFWQWYLSGFSKEQEIALKNYVNDNPHSPLACLLEGKDVAKRF